LPQYYRSGTEPLDEILRKIGTNLRNERAKRSLTQKQLSELTGIAQASISSFENGRLDSQISTLVKFAEALEIPLAVLADS